MNTQTHVLLAVSVFGGSGMLAIFKRRLNVTKPSTDGAIQKIVVAGLIFGALLPDLSLFIMFGYAQFLGLPHSVIWGEMYYSPFWQSLGAISNSIPIYLIAATISWLIMRNTAQSNSSIDASRIASQQNAVNQKALNLNSILLVLVCAIALASLAHALTDLPLHHDDGQIALGLLFIVVLWRRYSPLWSKLLLVVAALGYLLPYYLFANG